eukprot:CAMPEP_0114990440 /NCGR_PEP_ID=MMETSP0216-20121206/10798_1 /TAXON_ID=223996 /ORGANISM="Protocruzia adherens, Strain Boccale" /LENGTH=118 /DNA_ID=CAMNT_0002353617 /DNA_START=223 /DNA_END=579 /DNA_ORIENTATION=+
MGACMSAKKNQKSRKDNKPYERKLEDIYRELGVNEVSSTNENSDNFTSFFQEKDEVQELFQTPKQSELEKDGDFDDFADFDDVDAGVVDSEESSSGPLRLPNSHYTCQNQVMISVLPN